MKLTEKLQKFAKSGIYSFTMPGHKRRDFGLGDAYRLDITEIYGFDNLHHPTGILKELQQRLAAVYGVKEAWVSVNGSTAGNLAAVSAAAGKGSAVLIGRNAHKSIYAAAECCGARVAFVYPEEAVETDIYAANTTPIYGIISPQSVEQALETHPDIRTAVFTYPTYEGITFDLEQVVQICHRRGVAVIVDSAHGAHLGFDGKSPGAGRRRYFPEPAWALGADVVVTSLHKTLPAMTQTAAVLLPEGSMVDGKAVSHYLDLFVSSSPSYVLMASVDVCTSFLEREGQSAFLAYGRRLAEFYQKAGKLQKLRVRRFAGQDVSKIIVDGSGLGWTGMELMDWFRKEAGLELEMAVGSYAVALSSVADDANALYQLLSAMQEIDEKECRKSEDMQEKDKQICLEDVARESKREQLSSACRMHGAAGMAWMREKKQEAGQEIVIAYQEGKLVSIEQCVDKVSACFVVPYPPGIPLLVPGERITPAKRDDLERALQDGMEVEGVLEGRLMVAGRG